MMKKSLFICAGLCLLLALPGTALADDNTCDDATYLGVVQLGGDLSKSAAINYSGDEDWFWVVVPSDRRLIVYTTGATDTYGYLYNYGCDSMLGFNDDGGESLNFRIEQSVDTYGKYRIGVRGYRTSTGSYTLHVTSFSTADDFPNSCDKAKDLRKVQSGSHLTRNAAINYSGDWDFFSVDVAPFTGLRVYTAGSTDTIGYLYKLESGQCTLLQWNDDGPSYTHIPGWESWELPNFWIKRDIFPEDAGRYVIGVRGYKTSTGSYKLIVRGTQPVYPE